MMLKESLILNEFVKWKQKGHTTERKEAVLALTLSHESPTAPFLQIMTLTDHQSKN